MKMQPSKAIITLMALSLYEAVTSYLWNTSSTTTTATTALTLGYVGIHTRWSFFPDLTVHTMAAALYLAVEDIAANATLLGDYNIRIVSRDSSCNPNKAVATLVTLVQEENVDVIIGPTCSPACMALGYLAAEWNIPVISYSCVSDELSSKEFFWTFLRTASTTEQASQAIRTFVARNGWRKTCALSSEIGYTSVYLDSVLSLFPQFNITVIHTERLQQSAIPVQLHSLSQVCRGECPFW